MGFILTHVFIPLLVGNGRGNDARPQAPLDEIVLAKVVYKLPPQTTNDLLTKQKLVQRTQATYEDYFVRHTNPSAWGLSGTRHLSALTHETELEQDGGEECVFARKCHQSRCVTSHALLYQSPTFFGALGNGGDNPRATVLVNQRG